MIYLNRERLKFAAKKQVLDRTSGVMLVSLIYILLTDTLSTVVNLVMTNPITLIQNQLMSSMNSLMNQYQASGGAGNLDLTPAYSAMFSYARQLLFTPKQEIILFLFLLLYLYTIVMSYGYSDWAMRTVRGERLSWTSLFDHLWLAGKMIVLELLTLVLTSVGLVFFVLPGLYFYYSFRLARYVLLDRPDRSIIHVLRLSMRLSQGYKRQLFAMDLSFIGWVILNAFALNAAYTAGAAVNVFVATLLGELAYLAVAVFVLPYRELTAVNYYEAMRSKDLSMSKEATTHS